MLKVKIRQARGTLNVFLEELCERQGANVLWYQKVTCKATKYSKMTHGMLKICTICH
mgnify:CR=1 FL=1